MKDHEAANNKNEETTSRMQIIEQTLTDTLIENERIKVAMEFLLFQFDCKTGHSQ
jgi:coenzyme F420-reducing hydrogenase delta subunit